MDTLGSVLLDRTDVDIPSSTLFHFSGWDGGIESSSDCIYRRPNAYERSSFYDLVHDKVCGYGCIRDRTAVNRVCHDEQWRRGENFRCGAIRSHKRNVCRDDFSHSGV